VLAATYGPQQGFPELLVLDSTDPGQIRSVEARLDPARTLFVVASKSGTTLEPNVLAAHFLGAARRGSRFIAITDPGSALQDLARENGFWDIFPGEPEIGGRFSALSHFGLVPAAAMGLDVDTLLRRALPMVDACGPDSSGADNPGLRLGVLLGVAAQRGFDKLTLVVSPAVAALGAWLEQLIGESTGKRGVAIIPVDRERLAAPERYGTDRLFVYVRLESGADPAQDEALEAIARAGRPVATLPLANRYDLGKEFFRWEIATAVAGAVLGVNPFDQPDVESSKAHTRALMAQVERTGRLPDGAAARLGEPGVAERLRALLRSLRPGDYFAILAYLEMSPRHEELLQAVRHRVRDARRVATCLGFGPRFLHSTGQAHKGGPDTGVFLQLTADDAEDLPVPGRSYTFGVLKAAQARGDLAALQERGRRVLHLQLGADVKDELELLDAAVAAALG
jgi:transaldolase/glucose-6-phosphate isomerase